MCNAVNIRAIPFPLAHPLCTLLCQSVAYVFTGGWIQVATIYHMWLLPYVTLSPLPFFFSWKLNTQKMFYSHTFCFTCKISHKWFLGYPKSLPPPRLWSSSWNTNRLSTKFQQVVSLPLTIYIVLIFILLKCQVSAVWSTSTFNVKV